MRYYEGDLIEEIYEQLFKSEFINRFKDAEVNREFAYIKLNDDFVLKLERV